MNAHTKEKAKVSQFSFTDLMQYLKISLNDLEFDDIFLFILITP